MYTVNSRRTYLVDFALFPCLDVEHRKSFSELTQAEVHPATSASAPEGFLTSEADPNGATDGAKNSGETNKWKDWILVGTFSHCVLDPDRFF